ncbi:MAG TPA: Rieske (2Fe-2S) protein [Verrucomicrobiae bacterium]|jgi:menaquinol-cytochrome c reductase iron-sulfur subunit
MNEEITDESKALAPPHESQSRRRFLELLSIVLGAICTAALAVPGLAFVLAPIFSKTPFLWRDVGKLDDFKIGQTVQVNFLDSSPLPWAGVTARTAAWLRRLAGQEFVAFAVNCSHLGCPVRWMADANLFMCPCHGGVYYNDGSVAAGPPPRPLMRYPVRVQNGVVQIRTRPLPITT